MPKDLSSKVVTLRVLTSRKTLKILNTVKPVTRAFTVMDIMRQVKSSLLPQAIEPTSFCTMKNVPLPTSHITTGNTQGQQVNQDKVMTGPKYASAKIEGMIMTPIF